MAQKTTQVSMRLPDHMLARIQKVVDSGRFKDRSHFILEAIGRLLDQLERESYTGP